MAVTLELIYGKKLGLPEYSSHNFSVSLKTEVGNLEDIDEEVERVYRILQDSVDAQITHPGFVPGGQPSASNDNGTGWKCSDKQRELILKLVGEHNLDRQDIEQLAIDRFGHGVILLNKLEASGLIDELFQQTGRKNVRHNGSRPRAYGKAA